MKYIISLLVLSLTLTISLPSYAGLDQFNIRPVKKNEFYTFIKVFSEMRGPLRMQIIKDKGVISEDTDALKYVAQVKGDKDVKKALKENNLNWDQFTELMGNILLGYFSIQPDKTKAALIRQLSDYNLGISDAQIPAEYRQTVADILKTDQGAQLAGMALEFIIQIPPENVAMARDNKLTLDQMFYTRFWRDKI